MVHGNIDISTQKSDIVFNSLLHSRMECDIGLQEGFDLFSEVAFEQLLDIRDCPAYKIHTLLNENKKDIDFDVNGYDEYSDEKQRALKISTG